MIRTSVLIAILALASSGCVLYASPPPRRVVVVHESYSASPWSYDEWPSPSDGTTTVIESEPPPARYEVITESPGVDFVWIGGYWAWRGGWVWCPGCWRHSPRGYAWRPGVWVVHGGRSYWRGGGWVRHR
jgi:hypothetical protein